MGSVYSAFYYANEDSWQYTGDVAWFQWAGAIKEVTALLAGVGGYFFLLSI